MTLSVPRGLPVGHPDEVIACFEATAAPVFATLSRLTVGDRSTSQRLLTDTYVHLRQVGAQTPDHTVERTWLIDQAVTRFLADPVGPDALADPAAPDPDLDWTSARWASTLDAIRQLAPQARVVLELVEIEHRSVCDVAELLRTTESDIQACLDETRRTLTDALVTETPGEALSHAELWFDDDVRDHTRRALAEPAAHRSATRERHRLFGSMSRVGRARTLALATGLGMGALLVIGVVWLQSAPDHERGVGAPAGLTVGRADTGRRQTAVLGDKSGKILSFSMQLAGDLTDQSEVAPDQIVRYPRSHAVGVSWTGPCNRPAASITFTGFADGIGLQLKTGAFPVVSCVGMPRRWTVVVEHDLGDGPILPVIDGQLDHTFHGYTVQRVSDGDQLRGRWFGSVLVDSWNRPWVYVGKNCGTFGVLNRQSPGGAMFEVRTGVADVSSLRGDQIVGSIDCTAMTIPKVLYGPSGSVFPQTDLSTGQPIPVDPAAPRDCHGPAGSATDVPAERPYMSDFYDGDWSTFDGCLVRSDVIFSRHLSAACGWDSVRTVTVADTIGDRIGPVARTRTYVRDPQHLLAGDIPPLLHDITVPDRARDSGLRFGTDQLWYSPNSHDAIYIVTATDVERWPLVDSAPVCAS